MRSHILLAFLLALGGCQSQALFGDCPDNRGPISYAGGDGGTVDTAVVIVGACGSADGIPAEHAWLKSTLPGAKPKSQELITGKRVYDRFVVLLPNGDEREVYFDISSFYGKF